MAEPALLKQKATEIEAEIASSEQNLTKEIEKRRQMVRRWRFLLVVSTIAVSIVVGSIFLYVAANASPELQSILFGIGSGIIGSAATFLIIQIFWEPLNLMLDEQVAMVDQRLYLRRRYRQIRRLNGQMNDLAERGDVAASNELSSRIDHRLVKLRKRKQQIELARQRRIRLMDYMDYGKENRANWQ